MRPGGCSTRWVLSTRLKFLDFGTVSAHFGGLATGTIERMFATLDGTVDQSLERRRDARRCEVRAICEQQARLAQRLTEIVREADDEGDWRAAGCSSSAQWLAQISSSDHRSAKRITSTSEALRKPARARPRAEHRRAHARPGRGSRGVRHAGQRCRACARGGRQGAQRDRAGPRRSPRPRCRTTRSSTSGAP